MPAPHGQGDWPSPPQGEGPDTAEATDATEATEAAEAAEAAEEAEAVEPGEEDDCATARLSVNRTGAA